MLTLEQFLEKLTSKPNELMFEDTMDIIDQKYHFSDTEFDNGQAKNAAGENSGSCRLFAFAQLNQLTEHQTLLCFGQYYRDVLLTPEGSDHQNIRQFMLSGWAKVFFKSSALKLI